MIAQWIFVTPPQHSFPMSDACLKWSVGLCISSKCKTKRLVVLVLLFCYGFKFKLRASALAIATPIYFIFHIHEHFQCQPWFVMFSHTSHSVMRLSEVWLGLKCERLLHHFITGTVWNRMDSGYMLSHILDNCQDVFICHCKLKEIIKGFQVHMPLLFSCGCMHGL